MVLALSRMLHRCWTVGVVAKCRDLLNIPTPYKPRLVSGNSLNQAPPALTNQQVSVVAVNNSVLITLHSADSEPPSAFGKVIDGDLRVVELGSWLQPTKAEYYLQRL